MRHLVAGLCLFAAVPSVGQGPATFVGTRTMFIDPADADIGRGGFLLVARTGEVIIVDGKDDILRTYNEKGSAGTLGRKGEGPGEFRSVTRIGWIGDTVWALDPSLKRITLFGPNHKLVRTIPMPHMATTDKTGHDSSVTVTEVYTQALLSDGSIRVLASYRPSRKPTWANGVDSGSTLYVRVNVDGMLQGRIAVAPRSRCRLDYSFGTGGGGTTAQQFCAERLSTDWSGTGPIASVTVVDIAAPKPVYQVVLISEKGATLFSRDVPFVPMPIAASVIDSAVAAQAKAFASNGMPAAALAAMPHPKPATIFPPARRVLLGRDQSVWVEERIKGPGHFWRIFDSKGNAAGTVLVPANVSVEAADLHDFWGYSSDADGLQGIARYQLERVLKP